MTPSSRITQMTRRRLARHRAPCARRSDACPSSNSAVSASAIDPPALSCGREKAQLAARQARASAWTAEVVLMRERRRGGEARVSTWLTTVLAEVELGEDD